MSKFNELRDRFYELVTIEIEKTVPKIPRHLIDYVNAVNKFNIECLGNNSDIWESGLTNQVDKYYPVKRFDTTVNIKGTKEILDVLNECKQLCIEGRK